MKTFLAVFSVVLLAFGASIFYYRGDFAGSKPKTASQNNQSSDNLPSANPPSFNIAKSANDSTSDKVLSQTSTAPQYSSLEIRRALSGNIKVGQSVSFSAYGKDKIGAKSSVAASWLLSEPSVAGLNISEGEEVILEGRKAGKTKLTIALANLNASVDLNVVAASGVLGSTTGSNNTGVGSTKTVQIEVVPVEIRLYDSSGDRFKVGDSRQYIARVFYSDNSLKNLDVTWSVDPADLGSLDRTQGPLVNFKATRSGSGNLKVTFSSLSSSLYLQVN